MTGLNQFIDQIKDRNKNHPSREGMMPILQQFDELASDLPENLNANVELNLNEDLNMNDFENVYVPDLNVNRNNNDHIVKIDLNDIQEEIDFWNSSIVCYILGANPPIQVMEGFIRRIWRNYSIDKVVMVKKGMFIIRFHAMGVRDKVLGGSYFFDHKPVIMKAWSHDMDFEKEDPKVVPIWIQVKIGLKYWGDREISF